MSQMVIAFDSAMSPLLSAIHNTGHHQDPSACRHPASDPQAIGPRRRSLGPAGRRSPESLEDKRAFDCPGPYPTSLVPRLLTALEQELQAAQRVSRSIIVLVAGLALFHSAAHAHDRRDNGESVPVWVKTECCGPTDAHHLRPDQVRRNAAGTT